MTVHILGGGPAGLACLDGLLTDSADERVRLYEQEEMLGGMARTISWGKHGLHDLGPHKIFTLDQELLTRVRSLLPPNAWLTRPKTSRIFLAGGWLPYPPSPFALARLMGPRVFAEMVLGYGNATVRNFFPRTPPATFEEDIVARIGGGLYKALFRPTAIKLWGDPRTLDARLSQGRVQIPRLDEILLTLMGRRKKESRFEAHEFIYPTGGLQRIWEAIERRAEGRGDFFLKTRVESLRVRNQRIESIIGTRAGTQERFEIKVEPDDNIISTLPLETTAELLSAHVTPALRDAVKKVIRLNDLLLVFLKIDRDELIRDSWIFIPDPAIPFHRLSEQKSFDPSMTPDGSIVCCEIMSSSERAWGAKSDATLIEETIRGIKNMGISEPRVIEARVVRLPRSYPVYVRGFQEGLDLILSELDQLENFRTIGRHGAFNYIGTLDAMDIGYGAARWLLSPDRTDDSWRQERQRTAHYPVLD